MTAADVGVNYQHQWSLEGGASAPSVHSNFDPVTVSCCSFISKAGFCNPKNNDRRKAKGFSISPEGSHPTRGYNPLEPNRSIKLSVLVNLE